MEIDTAVYNAIVAHVRDGARQFGPWTDWMCCGQKMESYANKLVRGLKVPRGEESERLVSLRALQLAGMCVRLHADFNLLPEYPGQGESIELRRRGGVSGEGEVGGCPACGVKLVWREESLVLSSRVELREIEKKGGPGYGGNSTGSCA